MDANVLCRQPNVQVNVSRKGRVTLPLAQAASVVCSGAPESTAN